MAAIQPPSHRCSTSVKVFVCFALLSILWLEVQTQATQNTGSSQKDGHGLFNVYFIPAYRVATNRTLKPPPANSAIIFRNGLIIPRPKTTSEKNRISGAASDVHPEQQSPPQATGPDPPLRNQASAITQYLIGFRNGYQQQQYQQSNQYPQPNAYQQPTGYQQPIGYQQPNGYQQLNGYQQQTYTPIPPGYYPLPTRPNNGQQLPAGYYPFPAVYIPPSIVPKSATEPPPLPAINLNTGSYRASASVKDESVIKSAQINVTPTLATAGPIYATAADEIHTTIEPSNSAAPDATITASEESTTSKKSTTSLPVTSKMSAPTSTTVSDSKTSPASSQETRNSASSDKPKTPESSSTEKAKAEEHRAISRHFEFSEDKEHSQVNATGDIRLTASRKTSTEGEDSQKNSPTPAAQGLPPPFPTFPSLPINTPHPHSHPHPAIIQGPNGFFVGAYNPNSQVGVIPPPANNEQYNAYTPFGQSAALSHPGGFPVHPTFPTRYEDLYYGFAPGYPLGLAPSNNNASSQLNRLPQQQAQQAQQPAPPPNQPVPPNQPPLLYPGPPRQFYDVAGPQAPYTLPQQLPYAGYNAPPYQPPRDYSRYSDEVLQPAVARPFYAGGASLPNRPASPNSGYSSENALSENRGYSGDPANTGFPNRLYNGDPSGPSAPNRLYNADPGVLPDPLFNRGGFGGGGPPPFLTPGLARSDNSEANSRLTNNFVSPRRGVGTAYEVNLDPASLVDEYERRSSRRGPTEADKK